MSRSCQTSALKPPSAALKIPVDATSQSESRAIKTSSGTKDAFSASVSAGSGSISSGAIVSSAPELTPNFWSKSSLSQGDRLRERGGPSASLSLP